MMASKFWEEEVLRQYKINEIVLEESKEVLEGMKRESLIIYYEDFYNIIQTIVDPPVPQRLLTELRNYIDVLKVDEAKDIRSSTYTKARSWKK